MKKIYMPTMDELYLMQEKGTRGANVYRYLVIKAIESLAVEGVNYPNKGILKTSYNYIKEDEDIVRGVCMMFPEEISYSDVAKYDPSLCEKLISGPTSNNLERLDNLSYFSDSVLSNLNIVNAVIETLAEELNNNPKYRFTYKENPLLNEIFSRRIDGKFIYENLGKQAFVNLGIIEPAYFLNADFYSDRYRIGELIGKYGERYGLPLELGREYIDKDILSEQSTEVKRLIKCINSNKNNLY